MLSVKQSQIVTTYFTFKSRQPIKLSEFIYSPDLFTTGLYFSLMTLSKTCFTILDCHGSQIVCYHNIAIVIKFFLNFVKDVIGIFYGLVYQRVGGLIFGCRGQLNSLIH